MAMSDWHNEYFEAMGWIENKQPTVEEVIERIRAYRANKPEKGCGGNCKCSQKTT